MAQTILGVDSITFPSGTTAQRPASPAVGMVRFNSDTSLIESYTSGGWKGLEASIPAGANTNFFMASAPTGWTKSTTYNDFAMRVVSGTGGGTGGSTAFTTAFSSGSVGATTLSTSQMPSHNHSFTVYTGGSPGSGAYASQNPAYSSGSTTSAGSGGSHTHSLSLDVQYLDNIMCSKN